MRRTRRTSSRDSSQDSPSTDNERDIIWGDSPPPRRICLSTTPGRRVTRASAAEQDLTDLIECIHPKENKESSTPPLLGLWMRNRQEPDSGKKKHRPARLAKRTTGRKLSRIGLDKAVLDDLRILTEWTGNLAAPTEEPSGHPEKEDAGARTGGTDLEGGGDHDAMECDTLDDLFADDDVTNKSDCNKVETQQMMEDRRKSSRHSFSEDPWDNDDWYDDDSIIRIATQVENEALTQQMQQKKDRTEPLNSDANMISPTQGGVIANAKITCQSVNQSKTSISDGVNLQSKSTGHSVQTMPSGFQSNTDYSMTRGSKAVSTCTWTTQSTTQANVLSGGSQMKSWKPASTSYSKAPMYASRSNNVSYVNPKAVCTASASTTSTRHSAAYVSSAKPMSAKSNVYNNANKNVSSRTVQKVPVKASFTSSVSKRAPVAPVNQSAVQTYNSSTTNAAVSERTARVPPMTDAINAASVKGQAINDSLDDLFAGDNSLPDDMLLALLDNDSDFEEYTKTAPSTLPVVSNNSTKKQLSGHPKRDLDPSGRNVSNSCKPTINQTPTHSMTTRAQYSSDAAFKSKGSKVCGTNKYGSNTSAMKNTQAVVGAHSRLTRSAAQSPSYPPVSVSHQAVLSDRMNVVGVETGQGRKSLSQPVAPSAKEGGVSMPRCCSQQEIEQKRQAALAKRKKSKLRISPTT